MQVSGWQAVVVTWSRREWHFPIGSSFGMIEAGTRQSRTGAGWKHYLIECIILQEGSSGRVCTKNPKHLLPRVR